MNILAIGAHPDDIEFGCGGTLLKYSEKGHKVYILVMSKGGKGGDLEVRQIAGKLRTNIRSRKVVLW